MEEVIMTEQNYVNDNMLYPNINLSSGIIRIVLLNNCNYRCPHCFKEGELASKKSSNDVDFILKVVERGYLNFGIRQVKLTGGEPLLYEDLDKLLVGLRNIGITNFDLTTNGYFLLDKINILLRNNVKNITVTLNTLNKDLYKNLHKCGDEALKRVLDGLEALRSKEIFNISLNIVPLDIENQNILEVIQYAWKNEFTPRLCEPMHIAGVNITEKKREFARIYEYLEKRAVKVVDSKCSSVSKLFLSSNEKIIILRNLCDRRLCHDCGKYMYIRLTSEGKLKPCLSRIDTEISMNANYKDDELDRRFNIAINNMGNGINKDCNTGLLV
ncbi:radical SAM protein [Clostridium thermarum]|uniref:radical SAM protein n=1 Tax=Clostridium thermarum TaxID=1716543 RepID=UPI0013D4163F|nr:radical SAM protein [Clostridium thermarum]